jgi:CDP-6-deoxy-D-xylo-4-hexulose-3-dehydrase
MIGVKFMNDLKWYRQQIDKLVKEYADLKYSNKDEFIPGTTHVPVSGKSLDYRELQNMVNASLDGWLTTGHYNDKFERALAKFVGLKHALSVNSGSSANLVAFNTLTSEKLGDRRIKKGDEVIGVAAGFPTTINPQIQFGAVPVFVDVEIATHNVDLQLLESAITENTRAIMLAHALGNPFNAHRIRELCDKHNIWLIEDTCDALGGKLNGKNLGTFGHISTLSFYPAHHITMGEGGAVLTDDDQLKLIAESIRDWGRDCYCKTGCDNTCLKRFDWQLGELPYGYDHKYTYSHAGYNLKITDMQAACGLAQLEKLPMFISTRKKNFELLSAKLKHLNHIFDFPVATPQSEPSWFGYPLHLKTNDYGTREDLLRYLDDKNIGTRLMFAGNITKQPYFSDVNYKIASNLDNTNSVMNNTFWLGVFPGIGERQISYIADVMTEYFEF